MTVNTARTKAQKSVRDRVSPIGGVSNTSHSTSQPARANGKLFLRELSCFRLEENHLVDSIPPRLATEYAVRELSRDGYKVRVFQENHAFLAQLFKCLQTYSEREFVVHEDARLTYGECRALAALLAHHLRESYDIQPGDRVGLALPNSPEWLLSFIAIAALGAVPALINARASSEELAHCLTSTGCRLCIHGREALQVEIKDITLAELKRVVSAVENPALPETPRDPDDEALLMFTSGTTGLPKAASLSHLGVLTALKTIAYSSALIAARLAEAYGMDYETLVSMRPPPVNLLVFPLFHVSGCHAIFLSSLAQGGKLVLMSRWDAQEALALIAREKVTAFPAVPTMYRDILRLNAREQFDLSSLLNMSVGGQATPPALLADIHQAFPSVVMGSGYGMTESNGTVTLAVGAEFIEHPRSVGRVVSTIDAEARDEYGRTLPSNETGELHIRGAALMSGYVGQEASPFDGQGWFATGDLGYFDEQGRLYIVDRKTDMVISGGENIYCAEVERALETHPDVRECAAFGISDERLGEKLLAVVVPQPGTAPDEAALIDHCLRHLTKHKVPKAIIVRSDPLPRNASGKMIKRLIQQESTSKDT